MVAEGVWRWYHRRRTELALEWSSPRFAPERWQELSTKHLSLSEPRDAIDVCLAAGLEQLRADVLEVAQNFPGPYLVPV